MTKIGSITAIGAKIGSIISTIYLALLWIKVVLHLGADFYEAGDILLLIGMTLLVVTMLLIIFKPHSQ